MGIYSSGKITGVTLSLNDSVIFENTTGPVNIKRLKGKYDTLTSEDKNILIIDFYSVSSSTHMTWKTEPFISKFRGTREILENYLKTEQ